MNKRLHAKLKQVAYHLEIKEAELVQFEDQTAHAIFLVHGPIDTPYEGFSFRISHTPTPKFPLDPPSVKFIDQIWNPFVDFKTGLICCDILRDKWSPALTDYNKVLLSIISLLGERKIMTDGLNLEATFDMMNNYPIFFNEARDKCKQHSYKETQIYKDEERFAFNPEEEVGKYLQDENYHRERQKFLNDYYILNGQIKKKERLSGVRAPLKPLKESSFKHLFGGSQ